MTPAVKKPQVYLFCGEDTFTSFRKAEVWKKKFSEKYDHHAITCIDVESWMGSEDELLGICKKAMVQQSLFNPSTLVVIKNLFSSKSLREPLGAFLLEHLSTLHSGTFVLFMEGLIDKRLSLYKSFCSLEKKEVIRIESFDIPHGGALSQWVDSILKELHASMTSQARMAFCNCFDPPRSIRMVAADNEHYDLWLLWHELHKLASHAAQRQITHHDVALLCPQASGAHIFESMGFFSQRNTKKTIECVYSLLKSDHLHDMSSVLGMCSFFQNQLHAMLIIKDMLSRAQTEQHIAKVLEWKNERVRIVAQQAKSLSPHFLKQAALEFIQLEQLLKSRPIPAGSALLHTIKRALVEA